jgi:hypothetical protein
VQLRSSDPPSGVPEERTLVSVDLSAPGATATDAQLGPDPQLIGNVGQPNVVDSGATISLNDPWRYRIPAGCGAKILGVINGVLWETDDLAEGQSLPPQWQKVAQDAGDVVVEVTLSAEPAKLVASANGLAVAYRPSTRDRNAVPCASPVTR